MNTKAYRRYQIMTILVVLTITSAQAQIGSGYFNQAEELFKAKNYYGASVIFEKYLATEKNARPRSTPFAIEKKVKGKTNLDPHQEAVYQLAESYRMINDYQKAEKYYKEAAGYSKKAYPDAQYWYAVTLRANQHYDEALVQITAYLEKHTQLDDQMMGADRELEDLKFIQQQSKKAKDNFVISQMTGKDPASGYALVQRADGFVFTGITEETEKNGEKKYLNTLFESTNAENPLLNADPMDFASEEGAHEGMASFSHDGKVMFFTRWTKKNNQTSSAIFMSRWNGKTWSVPVKAADPLNVEGSNSAQPYLTQDGRYLLFSSDRPGGSGGYDLWASLMDTTMEPVQVRNLGNVINSAGDDEAPFLHEKTRTLVFSSNGRVGMGGFDIYYAKGNFGLNGWEKPENAGAPLNSSKDDLYYIGTDEDDVWNTGWISSDRSTECCLAMFAVRENNTQYVDGTVVDGKTHEPLSNVDLTVTDLRHPGRILAKYKADSAGRYAIELHNSSHFKITAERLEYEPGSLDFNLKTHPGKDSLNNEVIYMKPVEYPETQLKQLLKSLEQTSHVGNFAYKEAGLNKYTLDRLDSVADILKKFPKVVILVEGYTDGIGSAKYNLGLAQQRVNSCIRYLVSKGVSRKQLKGKAMGKCCPIAPETINGKDNPAGREVNRRVEYKVISH